MSSYPRTAQPALIVGSVAIDRVTTPFAQSANVLGGAASYASIAASYFTPTRLVGVVGGDFPVQHLRRLKRHGIDISGLKIEPAGKTFFWSGKYHEHFAGRDTLEVRLNVFETFSARPAAAARSAAFVMLGAIQPALQLRVLEQLSGPSPPFVLADTFDLWIHTAKSDLLRLLRKVDLFVINEDESLLLTGARDLVRAGGLLRKMGPRIVVIKKGAHGSMLFHPEGLFAISAFPVSKFIDPTGAGDSYAGALIGSLAAVNRTDFAALKRAVAYATAVASLTVESFSVNRLSSAGRAQIDSRFRKLREITQF